MRLPEWRGPFDVGEHERDDAGGQRDLARALEPLDELRRRGRPPGRVGIERAAQHPVESLGQLGRDAVPHDRLAGFGSFPVNSQATVFASINDVVGNRRGGGVAERGGTEHEHRAFLGGDR